LAEKFNNDGSRVKIAEVDCTDGLNKETCDANSEDGFPTLKFFKHNSDEKAVEYDSETDLKSLTKFVNKQSNRIQRSIPELNYDPEEDEYEDYDPDQDDNTTPSTDELQSSSPEPETASVLLFNPDNFHEGIKTGFTFVMFTVA
jgi:hypothetical protein